MEILSGNDVRVPNTYEHAVQTCETDVNAVQGFPKSLYPSIVQKISTSTLHYDNLGGILNSPSALPCCMEKHAWREDVE